MSENAPQGLGPSEQHELLLSKVGEWKVACKYFMNPTEDPIAAEGTDRVECIGPFWTTGRFECEVMGSKIEGLATTGFDPNKGKYIGTWQDSSNPYLYTFEGDFDEKEGTLTMEGENVDPMSGALVTYRSVEKYADDKRTLELYIDYGEDKVIQILEYEYERVEQPE